MNRNVVHPARVLLKPVAGLAAPGALPGWDDEAPWGDPIEVQLY
ncbi:MAG: hypothetical protein RLZZ216_1106 [Cyanobacteriota bacterium]|jgi:hypothetical protein